MARDLHNNIHPVALFAPKAAVADDTAQVSLIIDTQGYESCELVVITGANADPDVTYTFLVEHGDQSNLSDAAAAPDADLIGTEALAGFTFADDNEVRKIGYRGSKRYVRATVTPSGNATGTFFLAGVALLGHPRHAPTDNPPQ